MPLYQIMLPQTMLDSSGRAALAAQVTALHCEMAGVPADWVHIVYLPYATGDAFTAGAASDTVSLTVMIRAGRSDAYKRAMLERLWTLVQQATGAGDGQIVLGIQEVPASQAMEWGKMMPAVAQDAATA